MAKVESGPRLEGRQMLMLLRRRGKFSREVGASLSATSPFRGRWTRLSAGSASGGPIQRRWSRAAQVPAPLVSEKRPVPSAPWSPALMLTLTTPARVACRPGLRGGAGIIDVAITTLISR